MRKVLFVIGSLQIGGAETVLVDIINNIYKEFDITLLLVEKRGELLEKIPKDIKLKYLTKGDKYCLNIFDKFYNKIKRSIIYRFLGKNKCYVKRIYQKILRDTYDSEVGFLVGLPTEIVRRSPNNLSKKITWIHADVEASDHATYKKYYNIYKYFDNIVGVSEASIKTFEKTFPESVGKIQLIHNYIDINKIVKKSEENIDFEYEKGRFNLVSVGRLTIEKGYDRIVNIAKKYSDKINFYIIGSGSLEEELKNQISKNNIKNVKLLGLQKNPYPYIKKADAFLLSSRSEAYPTVILEAMILQKYIIATKVSGVEEILSDYDSKILVSNTDNSLNEGIDTWLNKKNTKMKQKNNKFEKINNENLLKTKAILND